LCFGTSGLSGLGGIGMETILKEENGIFCMALNIFVKEIFEERDFPIVESAHTGMKALL
jgi:hypothetical protein